MIKKMSAVLLTSVLAACVADNSSTSSSSTPTSSSRPASSSTPASSSRPASSSTASSSSAISSKSSSSIAIVVSSSSKSIPASSTAQSSSLAAGPDVRNKSGAELYTLMNCNLCHGDDGKNRTQPINFSAYSLQTMTQAISATMPKILGEPHFCTIENGCAPKVAEYVMSLAPDESCVSQPAEPLKQRLRLLTNREYANTINDLLGRTDGFSFIAALGTDTIVEGFDNNVEQGSSATQSRVEAYFIAAGKIASSQNDVTRLLDCGQQSQNPGPDDVRRCADTFIPKFGELAFRRKLSNDEINTYKAVFNLGTTREEGFKLAVQAFLSSPNFLYRSEIGVANGSGFKLDDYEIASLLSYTLWGTMPDVDLMRAASAGQLGDANVLKQHATRLLNSSRAKAQFAHFARQWLRIKDVAAAQRSPELFPAFNPAVGKAMETELELFMAELLTGEGYTPGDIFKSNFTFLNRELANFYGIDSANLSSTEFKKVTVGAQYSGVLSKGALLTLNAAFKENHPIRRGLLVRRNLLCQEFGTPPPAVGDIEGLDQSLPLRERLLVHTQNQACAFCHQFIDPIGFAFEHYNAVGQYRGISENASGSLVGMASMANSDSHDFNNLQELSNLLAVDGKDQIASCITQQYHRYYQGVTKTNACEVTNNLERWKKDSSKLKDLWLTPLADPNFTKRK